MGDDSNQSHPDIEIEGDANVIGDGSVAMVAKVTGETVGDVTQVAGDYYAPSDFWSDVKTLTGKHWRVLLALLLVDGILLLAYPTLQSRYLIEPLITLVIAVLASVTILSLSTLANRDWRGVQLRVVSGLVSVLLISTLAWRMKQIMWPQQFPAGNFGVAVAYFGEGAEFRPSRHGTQIALDLVEKLGNEAKSREEAGSINVDVGKIGIVRSSAEAKRWGQRLGADLVIWGRLVVGEERAVTVHFEIAEIPASAGRPEQPRVLPIGYAYSAEVSDQAADIRGLHHFDIKEAVAGQSNAITYFVLGMAFYLERDFQDAIPQLEEALEALKAESSAVVQESAADPALVHYYLGKSYQMLGRMQDSVGELEEAARLNRDDPAAQLGLSHSYRVLERDEESRASAQEAVRLCNEVLKRNPRSEEALYDLGLAYEMLEQQDVALDTYLRLIEVNPDFHIAYISAGRIYALQERFDAAIRMYQTAVEKAEAAGFNGGWAYVDLGDVYLEQGKTASALEAYLTAVQLEPEQAWMHFRLAQFYQAQGDIDLAWEAYERFVTFSANKAWANATLGDFLLGQQLFDLAIISYKKARMFNPDSAVLSIRLGKAYLRRYQSSVGQPSDADEAEAAFGEALSQLPVDSPTRFYAFAPRGQLHFYRQRFELAIDDFVSALELDPRSSEIQFSLARTYHASGKVQEACAAYKRVLDPELDAAEELIAHAQEMAKALCRD